MSERALTVDVGNSRTKLVVFEPAGDARDARVVAAHAIANGPALAHEIGAWIAARPGLCRSVSSSVAAPALEREVLDVLARAFGARAVHHPDSGLEACVLAPENVGRDRLYAARAALEIVGDACVVVNAGTALTVDAAGFARDGAWLGRAPRDVRPSASLRRAFGGGAIAPGPWLGADALARHAARLPRVDPRPGAAALGRDTHAAISAGLVVGFRGAAIELARAVALEAGLAGAPIVVTGGARAFLLEPTSCWSGDVRVDEHLVPRGLWLAGLGV